MASVVEGPPFDIVSVVRLRANFVHAEPVLSARSAVEGLTMTT